MARYLTYTFPAGNATDVCATQAVAQIPANPNRNLAFNGNLSNQVLGTVNFLNYGYSRQISCTTTHVGNVTFTINGIQNGVSITEQVVANANTAYSDFVYDSIVSISIDIDANGCSVGTGHIGFFPLIDINLERDVINYNFNIARLPGASIHTTIYGTLANIYQNGSTYLNILLPANNNNQNLLEIKPSAAEDQWFFSTNNTPEIYNSILVYINGTVEEIGNSIQINFRQT